MSVTFLRILVTVASFAAFLANVAYAIHPRNRERIDEASRLPLDEDRS